MGILSIMRQSREILVPKAGWGVVPQVSDRVWETGNCCIGTLLLSYVSLCAFKAYPGIALISLSLLW